MKNINTQKIITERVVEYKRTGGTVKTCIYNEIFNMLTPTIEKRAVNFIKSTNKNTLLVDTEEYISVALFEGLHKAIESYDIEKNDNFIPYLYRCVDNALKSQVGKDCADRRIVNEQAITYTGLVAMLGGQDLSDLDRLDTFVSEDTAIERLINTTEEPEMVKEFRKAKGDLKADVILCYTLEEDLQQKAICEVYGETEYEGKVKVRACRVRKEFKEFLLSCNGK